MEIADTYTGPDEVETAFLVVHTTIYGGEHEAILRTKLPKNYEELRSRNGRKIFRSTRTGQFVSKKEVHDALIDKLLE